VSDNDQLLPIRQLELFRQRAVTEADARLPEKEKAARLKQIDDDLARLDRRMKELARK
jgi:phosphonate transport system substrate-binding protein